ncbi:MAG TPA: PilW family protein [Gammaproteobacteria bacterium]
MNKLRSRFSVRARQAGLSIVELMVSLLISMFLIAGAVTVLVNSRTTYTISDDMAKLQENLRIASQFLTRDIRMAGYYGCSNTQDTVNNLIALGDELYARTDAIEGLEGSAATVAWKPSDSNDLVASITGGTDGITIRSLVGGQGFELNTAMADTSSDIQIDANSGFTANSLAAIYNCSSANLFQVSAVTSGANDVLEHATALGQAYTDATVAPVFFIRYFIGAGTGGPSLFRQVYDGAAVSTQELVEGIETMQFLYGIDTDADGVPNSYVEADDVADWNNVVAVRFGLLGRTIAPYAGDGEYVLLDENKTYNVIGTVIADPEDRRTRQVVSNTVLLRNLQP